MHYRLMRLNLPKKLMHFILFPLKVVVQVCLDRVHLLSQSGRINVNHPNFFIGLTNF